MREYAPGRPLVFNHIPKTAGTSLRQSLLGALRPQVCVTGYDAVLAAAYGPAGVRPPPPDRVFFSPDEIPGDADLVMGHIAPSTTRARFAGADHVTFLRNPQARILSQWMHGRAVTEFDIRRWGEFRESFRLTWQPLPEYLQIPKIAASTDNTITRFLVSPHRLVPAADWIREEDDDELYAAAVAELDRMDHVDIVENPGFVSSFADWLGRPLTVERANDRGWVPARRRAEAERDFGPETHELLARRTRIDVRLWEHVARRVLPDADRDEMLSDGVRSTMDRYLAISTTPPKISMKRRLAVAAYDVRARLSGR